MSRLETTAWVLTDGDGVCRVQLLQIWPGEAEYSSTALLGPAEAGVIQELTFLHHEER